MPRAGPERFWDSLMARLRTTFPGRVSTGTQRLINRHVEELIEAHRQQRSAVVEDEGEQAQHPPEDGDGVRAQLSPDVEAERERAVRSPERPAPRGRPQVRRRLSRGEGPRTRRRLNEPPSASS